MLCLLLRRRIVPACPDNGKSWCRSDEIIRGGGSHPENADGTKVQPMGTALPSGKNDDIGITRFRRSRSARHKQSRVQATERRAWWRHGTCWIFPRLLPRSDLRARHHRATRAILLVGGLRFLLPGG